MVNPVVHAIMERRSIRSYQEKQIAPEQLKTLMEVAVASPSARNSQPWHFSFVQNANLLQDISLAVAQALDRPGYDVFYHAPPRKIRPMARLIAALPPKISPLPPRAWALAA